MSLNESFYRYIRNRRMMLGYMSGRLVHPAKKIQAFRLKTDDLTARLIRIFDNNVRQKREHLLLRTEQLRSLNPSAILSRGYSIASSIPDKTVIRDKDSVSDGQMIELRLANGILICRVERKG